MLEKLLALITKLAPNLDSLFLAILEKLLPDFSDAESVRQFVLKYIGKLQEWVPATLLTALAKIANDAAAFAALYGLVVDLITQGDDDAVVPDESSAAVAKLADDAKLDPTIIVALIAAIVELVKWWKNRT